MAKFTMLIGLPGSGKTTYARSILQGNEDWVHISSDEITQRSRLPDESVDYQNTFEEMYQRTVFHLKNDINVIYDATNLASKRRRSMLNRIEKFESETEAIVFLTPYAWLKKRNSQRQASDRVPDHIIERYLRAFQLPRKDEKFDWIRFLSLPPYKEINPEQLKKQAFSFREHEMFFKSFEETKPMTESAEMRALLQPNYKIIEKYKKKSVIRMSSSFCRGPSCCITSAKLTSGKTCRLNRITSMAMNISVLTLLIQSSYRFTSLCGLFTMYYC